MKAYYYLAQAEAALSDSYSALLHAKEAHRICVADGAKGQGSLTNITELVLQCKKADWDRRENIRIRERRGLLRELEDLLAVEKEKALSEAGADSSEELEQEYKSKVENLQSTFEVAKINEEDLVKKRVVPDWLIDGISFTVMLDPVVVSGAPLVHGRR